MQKTKKVARAAAEEVLNPQVSVGTVKWFNPQKGYGFIPCPADGGGEVDVFVHFSSILIEGDGFRTLYDGEEVRFEVVSGKSEGTWEAKNVEVLKASPRRERRAQKKQTAAQ